MIHGGRIICKAVLEHICRAHTRFLTLTDDKEMNYVENMFLNCAAGSYIVHLLPEEILDVEITRITMFILLFYLI